jgi:uncharacterized membrane protein (UPF0182 family)
MPPRTPLPLYPAIDWLQRRTKRQWLLVAAVAGAFLLYRAAKLGAGIMLDRWWYDTVTDAPIWSTITVAKLQLLAGTAILTALIIGSTVWVVLRSKPVGDRPINLQLQKFHERVGPAYRWALIGFTAYLTIHIGLVSMDQWPNLVLFREGPSLGVDAPEIGGDIGYHLFRLPLLATASSWLRQLVLVAIAIAFTGHVLAGAIRLPGRGRRSAPVAWVHLGLLGAAFAGLQALDYVFVRRPSLATNRSGSFDGPGYTELNVVAPSFLALALIALAVGFMLVNGARTGRWKVPLVAIGVWAVAQFVLLNIVPSAVDTYVVEPAEAARQLPYIAENLAATQTAYRLDAVGQTTETISDGVSAAAAADTSFEGIPVFDTSQLVSALQVLQGTPATRINDVDLDRYELDGTRRPVMVAARPPSRADLPERGWVQSHLVYTHGDGAVVVPADAAAPDGRPDVAALTDQLTPRRTELYFADGMRDWYAIVGTERTEQGGESFDADTGIRLDSMWKRLALSLSTDEIEPLTSAELKSGSQLLYRRDVRERLEAVAPFLSFDSNPYPVMTEDRVVWVVDGYTSSSRFPYAQFAPTGSLPASSGLRGRDLNYVHAAVKATVDAYDGTVHLYRTEIGGVDDPILDAWSEIFPDLIEPISAIPDDLAAHLKYPNDLLTLQSSLLGRYHVDDTETLFSGTQRWAVSPAVSSGVGQAGSGTQPALSTAMQGDGPLAGNWVAQVPYSPGASGNPGATRDNLAALAIADHDDPERLDLITIEPASGREIASPLVAQSAIDADPELARQFTLLNANGSVVQFGPMTPILLDDGLVWMRPVIVTGTADTTAPRLYGVVAVSNGIVGFGEDVEQAVDAAVG